ncbi:MAG: protein kinase [Planctomycetales bacterium]|nr:protein kinase [Planctomycetales bacterium]
MADSQLKRNQLLRALSVQTQLVSLDDATTAAGEAERSSRSISQILVQQGKINKDQASKLDSLCDSYVSVHDGSYDDSVATLCREMAFGVADPDAPTAIRNFRLEARAEKAAQLPSNAQTDLSRYQILRPHAKGGLGEVFVALDGELNREVALKEIQLQHAHDESMQKRFLLEAEVTGKLEHPGIVPIYGLGVHADGRPYYAMRFVHGDNLEDAIKRFHEFRVDDEDRTLVFRGLLQRFVDVCQSVAFAHSRGVLHRDLKPSNVMLGSFGETLVVDWGLAKMIIPDEGDDFDSDLPSPTKEGSHQFAQTHQGSAIGTPAYMSPEQAAGQLDLIGPASDIYSLGATLYHIVTGRPSQKDKILAEMVSDIQTGNFPRPREVKSLVPRPIEAICLKAMSLRIADRYASALELSDDVNRYLADESVTAWHEPVTVRLRRWLRRHQTAASSIAVALLVAAASMAVLSFVVTEKNTKLSIANEKERAARELAEANEAVAKAQSQLALATLTSVIHDIEQGLHGLSRGSDIRRRLLATSMQNLRKVSTQFVSQASVDSANLDALMSMADVVAQFGTEEPGSLQPGTSAQQVAIELYSKAKEIAAQLVDQDPDDELRSTLALCRCRLGKLLIEANQSEEAEKEFTAALKIHDRLLQSNQSPQNQTDVALTYAQLAEATANRQQVSEGYIDRALQMIDQIDASRLSSETVFDLSLALARIGDLMQGRSEPKAAIPHLESALGMGRSLLERDSTNSIYRRHTSTLLERLGMAHERQHDTLTAKRIYEEMLQFKQELVDDDPADLIAKLELGITYRHLGDVAADDAQRLNAYQQSDTVLEELTLQDPSNPLFIQPRMLTLAGLAVANHRLGNLDEAKRVWETSLAERRRFAEINSNYENVIAESQALVQLSLLSIQVRQPAEAIRQLDEALVRLNSVQGTPAIQATIVDVLVRKGSILEFVGRTDEAEQTFTQIDKMVDELIVETTSGEPTLSNAEILAGLGENISSRAQLAEKLFAEAIRLSDAAPESQNLDDVRKTSTWYERLGMICEGLSKFDAALEHYDAMAKLKQKIAIEDPHNEMAQVELAIALRHLGDIEWRRSDSGKALEHYQESGQVSQSFLETTNRWGRNHLSTLYGRLGALQRERNELDDAIRSFQSKLEVDLRFYKQQPKDVTQRVNLTQAYANLGDLLTEVNRVAEGLQNYRESRAISDQLRSEFANNVEHQRTYVIISNKLAAAFVGIKDYASATDVYEDVRSTLQQFIESGFDKDASQVELEKVEGSLENVKSLHSEAK